MRTDVEQRTEIRRKLLVEGASKHSLCRESEPDLWMESTARRHRFSEDDTRRALAHSGYVGNDPDALERHSHDLDPRFGPRRQSTRSRAARPPRLPVLLGAGRLRDRHSERQTPPERATGARPSGGHRLAFRYITWRWRESNPRPRASQWVFSERSRLWIFESATAAGGGGAPYPA